MISGDIIKALFELAPPYFADKWDNSGLQLGSYNKNVNNILLALDISPEVVKNAIENNIDMIITHHPLIFDDIKKICRDDKKAKMLYNLIKEDIVVFSAHTNLDMCKGGVSDVLGDILGLKNQKVLSVSYTEKLFKLVVFVPKSHSNKVREAITYQGAGHIGNYSCCTFNVEGFGTFMPHQGSNPYIGETDRLENVEEVRIETIVTSKNLDDVLIAMHNAHPYEEVAYDVYLLANDNIKYGHGRIGEIDKELSLVDYAEIVKTRLKCDSLRVYGNINKKVNKIAFCGGSGADFITDAYKMKADVFITGDIRYHEAQLASELGICLIDAGHYHTEKPILDSLKKYLCSIAGEEVNITIFKKNNFPFLSL